MLNQKIVSKAISERQNGVIQNFANIELNQAVDLVMFDDYTIEQVCSMSSEELDMASNPEDDIEDPEYYICPNCGKKFAMEYDGERYEGYTGFCDCGKDFKVSYYGMDNYCDSLTDEEYDAFNEHEYIQSCINFIYAK